MNDHTWDGPDDEQHGSDLDALTFGDHHHCDDHDDWSGLDPFTVDETPSSPTIDDDAPSGPLTFGVTNPAGTITAHATISGAIVLLELSPTITSVAESDLAREILATSKLANLQGRAIQRAMVQSLLMQQGMAPEVAEQYIDDLIDLPTPAQAEAAQAEAQAEYLRNANTDRW